MLIGSVVVFGFGSYSSEGVRRMNLLVSYAHIVKHKKWEALLELWASKGLPLMIDCGAFSASRSGTIIDHSAYMMLCKKLQAAGQGVEYIQLDEIRNPKATRANLLKEYAAGLKSIPVLTDNATLDEFAELVEKFNPRVCIAGATVMPADVINRKIARCWKKVDGKTKIHALGYSNGWAPFKSKAYSYDSTSWLASLKWGNAHFFDPLKGITTYHYDDVRKPKFHLLPKEVRNTFMCSGVTSTDLRSKLGGRTQRSLVSFISCNAWLEWARKVEHNDQRFYFAAVTPWMLCQLILSAIHNQRGGINWPALKKEMPPLMETLSRGETDLALVSKFLDRAIVAWDEMVKV